MIDETQEQAICIAAKRELRKRMRGLRSSLPAQAIAERSAQIAARLEALPAFAEARAVGLFWPIEGRNEVDLRDLAARCLASGKRVGFPDIDPETSVMRLLEVRDTASLDDGPHGFKTPPAGAPELDALGLFIVAPALVVDERGHRVGYGAGYYDRMLPLYAPPALTAAVAFDFQLVGEAPTSPRDVAVRWVVTDTQTIEAGRPSASFASPEGPTTESGVKTIARPRRGP